MPKRKCTAERAPKKEKNKKKRYENDEMEDTDDEAETTIVLYERWDFDKLASICELVMDPSKERLITSIFSSMLAARSTRRMVKYTPKAYKDGRLYGTGLQGVCGWIRRICSYAFYHDVDIVNCGPTLLVQIIERTLGSDACPSLLAQYANDRQAVFHQLRREVPEIKDVPDKKLKQVFLVGLHNGNHINHFRKLGLEADHAPIPFFVRWERQMKLIAEKLKTHKRYKKIWKQINKLNDKPNKLGTCMSWIYKTTKERAVTCHMMTGPRVHDTIVRDALLLTAAAETRQRKTLLFDLSPRRPQGGARARPSSFPGPTASRGRSQGRSHLQVRGSHANTKLRPSSVGRLEGSIFTCEGRLSSSKGGLEGCQLCLNRSERCKLSLL
jgi:hypothetical protein